MDCAPSPKGNIYYDQEGSELLIISCTVSRGSSSELEGIIGVICNENVEIFFKVYRNNGGSNNRQVIV